MVYKETLFYFFSGTGNSYRVATWLNNAARKAHIQSAIQSIDRGFKEKKVPDSVESLIGLIFPTHGFTAPWPIIRFALCLPKVKGTNAIVIPTRAGTKIGSLFLPGFQGTAGYLLALILALRGYDVRGVIGIDMPSNWTALHWGLSNKNAKAIIARAQKKTASFIHTILSGKQLFKGFVELILGLLLLPISFAYLIYGRFQLAKLFFASDRCNGCCLCSESCPVRAIKMIGRKPYWSYKCENCMRCMNFCPTNAVEASHPLAIALAYITGIPAADLILNRLDDFVPMLSHLNNRVTMFFLQYVYFLTSIFIVYLVFSFMNRIPVISKIFKVLTLTHYYRRYHEPDTKINDLTYKRK